MIPRQLLQPSSLRRSMQAARRLPLTHKRCFFPPAYTSKKTLDEKYPEYPTLTDAEDPEMNGGYINPPAIKRQFRDPYGDWWDNQERRNFGEPVHEDNDLLGIFSPYAYTWTTAGKGLIMLGCAVSVFLSIVGAVYLVYPDRVAYPREFEDGLERELGGSGTMRARKAGDPEP